MSDILTQLDPVITHDSRPSHAARPDWLTEQAEIRDLAWKAYENVCAEEYDQRVTGTPNYQRVQDSFAAAEAQEAYYHELYGAWMRETVPLTALIPAWAW